MVEEIPPPILGNVHVLYIKLAAGKIAVAVCKRRLARAYRFYLGAGKHNPGRIFFQKLVFESGPLVLYLYIAFALAHNLHFAKTKMRQLSFPLHPRCEDKYKL